MSASRGGCVPSTGSNERRLPSRTVCGTSSSNLLPVPFVKDQGEVPCCTSAGLSTCFDVSLSLKARGISTLPENAPRTSMMYHFFMADKYLSRNNSGRRVLTEGMTIGESFSIAARYGLPTYALYRQKASPHLSVPSDKAIRDAGTRRLDTKKRRGVLPVSNAENWIKYIDKGYPILLEIYIRPEAYDEVKEAPDYTHGVAKTAANKASHVVTVVGYHKSADSFVIADCQGDDFANKGFWYVTRSLANSNYFRRSAHVIRRII